LHALKFSEKFSQEYTIGDVTKFSKVSQSKVAKSTLADANEKRDWRIYCDFAQVLIAAQLTASPPWG
jgi:hypothetical protein